MLVRSFKNREIAVRFVQKLNKINGLVCLFGESFGSKHIQNCNLCRQNGGGNSFIGQNKFMASPWEGDWGKAILVYLFGNPRESKIAYNALQEVEEKEWIQKHDEYLVQNQEPGKSHKGNSNNLGYIYVVKNGEAYKIGRAKRVRDRYRGYITENPNQVSLVLQKEVVNYIDVERNLHNKFASKRIRGEWFRLADTDLIQITKYLHQFSYAKY